MNISKSKTVAFLFMLAVCAHLCFAQDSSKNADGFSPPPELKRFEPFLGRYSTALDWPSGNFKWEGSFELAYAIKGWYIESNLIKESAGHHLHWRLLIAWDTNEKKYRVWRFETATPLPALEGIIRFESDNEWYAEWQNFLLPGGKRVTYFSRFRLKSKDELEIESQALDAAGRRIHLGVLTYKRKK